MEKKYVPTILYIVKILATIFLTVLGFLIFDFGLSFLGFVIPNMILIIIKVVLLVMCIGVIVLTLMNAVPVIKVSEIAITIKGIPRRYIDIQYYRKALGGSEPYLILKDGRRIDIELSWFRKKDQQEIEQVLINKVGEGEA